MYQADEELSAAVATFDVKYAMFVAGSITGVAVIPILGDRSPHESTEGVNVAP
jgi:hypothetical protein